VKTNIKLTIQYDGTYFNGWQVQRKHPEARTVQSVIQNALQKIVKEPVHVIGAGRTDAGVHARGQVANFRTSNPIPEEKWPVALNSILPPDVAVIGAEEVPGDFHAQYSAAGKTYHYYILNSKYPDVFLRNYAYFEPRELDLEKMQQAALRLKGTHNFKSFCAVGSGVRTFERTVTDIGFVRRGRLLIFKITADGFLYKMARSIVGTLLEIGKNRYPPDWIDEVLKAEDRKRGGPTAPPQGLVLYRVYYDHS